MCFQETRLRIQKMLTSIGSKVFQQRLEGLKVDISISINLSNFAEV